MKTLLPLVAILLFTACGQPKKGSSKPLFPPLPESLKDSQKRYDDIFRIYMTGKTEFADLFEDIDWQPFIFVQNETMAHQNIIEDTGKFTNRINPMDIDFPDRAFNFQNVGKVLVYTNKHGGIKINDEEILLAPSELSNFIQGNSVLKDDYWYARYKLTLAVYTGIYTDFLEQFSLTNTLGIVDDFFLLDDAFSDTFVATDAVITFLSWQFPEYGLLDIQKSLIKDPARRARFESIYSKNNNPIVTNDSHIFFAPYAYRASILPLYDIKKLYITLLNLFFLDSQNYGRYIYWGDALPTPQYFSPMRVRSMEAISIDLETGKPLRD